MMQPILPHVGYCGFNCCRLTLTSFFFKAMASTEEKAYEIMRELDVSYVLVIFGGLTGYSSDGNICHSKTFFLQLCCANSCMLTHSSSPIAHTPFLDEQLLFLSCDAPISCQHNAQ